MPTAKAIRILDGQDEAAEIILSEVQANGGEESALVKWARMYQQRRLGVSIAATVTQNQPVFDDGA